MMLKSLSNLVHSFVQRRQPVHLWRSIWMTLLPLLSGLLLALSSTLAQAWSLDTQKLAASASFQKFQTFEQASLLILEPTSQTIYARNPDKPLIPASTTKLLTALLALNTWGREYHFRTEIYLQPIDAKRAKIWVRGLGDPFLVSEELLAMAKQISMLLVEHGIEAVEAMVLDKGFYQSDIQFPGRGESDNPYDAIPTAIAANFNTAYVGFDGRHWYSAEEQTPLTQVAVEQARSRFFVEKFSSKVSSKDNPFAPFKQRINLGVNPKTNEMHFAQLLTKFLQQQGVQIASLVEWQTLPTDQQWPKLVYHNVHSLEMILAPMLKYSTNFIANQLSLNLAADFFHLPAGEKLVESYFAQKVKLLGVNATFIEGAGLSRNNQVSAKELIQIVKAFAPYKDLLPEVKPGIWAKSGTLNGVTTLAGFIEKDSEFLPFVLLVNQPAGYGFRNRLLSDLREALKQ